jgi:hypothetical protein
VYGDYTKTVTYEQVTTQYYTTFDLSGGTKTVTVDFTCPVQSTYLRTSNLHKDSAPLNPEQFYPGSFYVYVQNALVVGSGAPQTVVVQFWVSAPDVDLYYMKPVTIVPNEVEPVLLEEQQTFRNNNSSIHTRPTIEEIVGTTDKTFQKQVGEEEEKVSSLGMVVDNKEFVRFDNIVTLDSIRQIGKKSNLFDAQGEAASVTTDYLVNDLLKTGMMHVLSSMYAARRGNWRYHFAIKPDIRTGSRSFDLFYTATDQAVTNVSITSPFQQSKFYSGTPTLEVVSVETPFLTQFKFLLTPEVVDSVTPDSYFTQEGVLTCFAANTGFDVLTTFADETRFALLVGPPLCSLEEINY